MAFSAVLFASFLPIHGQTGTAPPNKAEEDLSVEEILGVQVTSVSRKAQQVANAPAAVYVITQEDIRRSGATTIPDVLRIVPGLNVARINGNTWAISARGGAGQFANKMQVMIDGRPVYNRLFSGVFWDTQDLLLEDIDRIEVIRGTGAVMWGSNAVNGVIHIITKSTRDTQGSQATIGTGNEERAFASYRYGGKVGERLEYRVWGKENYRRFYAPGSGLFRRNPIETPGQQQRFNEGSADDQGTLNHRLGFRLDWQKSNRDSIQMSGMAYRNDSSMENWLLDQNAVSRRVRVDEDAGGANLQLRWVRTHAHGAETSFQFWGDRTRRESELYTIRLDALDFEVQHRRALSETNEISIGVGTRWTKDYLVSGEGFRFGTPSRTDNLSNLMIRDEMQWFRQRLTLSLGARAEHNDYTGFEWQPSVRLLFNPNKSHSIWGAWSRAVRTPSRSEHDAASIALGQTTFQGMPIQINYRGNRNFASERIDETAAGYRYQRRNHWSVDVTAFHARDKRLASLEFGALNFNPGPPAEILQAVYAGNGRTGTRKGIEVAASGSVRSWWKLHGSYSFLSSESDALATSTDPRRHVAQADPRHQFKMRSLWNLSHRWQWDVSLYRISEIAPFEIPGYLRIDTRLGFKPVRTQDLSFIVQDWMNQRRLEYPSELYGYSVAVRRSMLVRWTVRF